jgi:SAM-dependent methyltransferase
MTELSQQNPLGRFSDRADLYARHRPSYPAEAVSFIITNCGLDGHTLLVDIGCGTGISTRLFAERGIPVLGIEPNDAMRTQAEAATPPAGGVAPRYQPGRAEATCLPDGAAAAVLSAQAFHWFDPPSALEEFRRILCPGGWVALMWNERDEQDPFTGAVGDVMRTLPDTNAVELPRARANRPLLESTLFQEAQVRRFGSEQVVDEDGLLGRMLSASYAPREPAAVEVFAAALRQVFDRFQQEGKAILRYETAVTVARRRDVP